MRTPPAHTTEARPSLDRAYLVCGGALLAGLVALVLLVTHMSDARLAPTPARNGVLILLGIGFALAGLFVIAHRSGLGLGWLLLWTGLTQTLGRAVLMAAAFAGVGNPWATIAIVLVLVCDVVYLFAMYALPLWLPQGRLPRGPVRVYAVAVAGWSVVHAYDDLAESEFYHVPSFLRHGVWPEVLHWLRQGVTAQQDLVPPLVVLTSLVVMTVHWVRSPGPHPMRLVPLLPYLAWLAVVFGGYRLDVSPGTYDALLYASSLTWPVTFAYAFARDREWHLDRSTRRMLATFGLAAVLIAGWFAVAAGLAGFLPGARSTGAVVLAGGALAIGILIRPTVTWAMHVVDRFYYGERARPYQVVRDLATRLSRAVVPGAAPALLCETVVRALHLPGASVVVDTRRGTRELARVGTGGAGGAAFPLTYEGVVIGRLSAPPRPGEDVLDRQDVEVLRFLADQAAPAIASLRLYEDLQESRERIVLAREEERRRLRHDLHDGLGPALSGTRLQVDTARACVPAGTPAEGTLAVASEGIGEAIVELRRITEGLAPAALDRMGLAGALRESAARLDGRTGSGPLIRVEVDPDPLPALPAAVEVAVYRIGGEALNNVVRHARAAHAALTVRVRAADVTVEISDDGRGRPADSDRTAHGIGMRSMAERAEELGGTFTVGTGERGTLVRAVLPRPTIEARDETGTDAPDLPGTDP
ncbi:ATP-binding protein [Streptomyces sp. SID3343]|uniref:GAF domain-containing sensor histidine kinase n=1 Tax=Streptomyces sp. SID3343 TaxID=2690260 RepID=UPI00136AC234|nr:ATP-binding protein [Streptomyces sp. SID3343]MYW02707.1 histidine kinase [Streptomyces sp. SID3343]